jgi:hypothetical protein
VKLVLFAKYHLNGRVNEVEMGRACSTNKEKMNTDGILTRNPKGQRPLGKPGRRWVDNIKIDLGE